MKPNLQFYLRGMIGLFFLLFASMPSEARFSVYAKADSSSFKQFKGSILDSKTRNELIYASITVSGTSISTISNSEGKFSIKVPAENQNATLLISFLGYKNKVISIQDLKPEKNVLYLEPSNTLLEEVVVKAGDAKNVYSGVLANRLQNYGDDPIQMTAFYRETIRKTVEEAEGKFVRQSGGKGQYGHVVLKVEPQEAGKGFEFVDAIKGGVVPREYIPAVQKGVEEALGQGVLAGYPVVDVKVTLHFGSYHDVDSNEMAFKMAAIFGFKEGCRKASPVILEPMMAVEVETPEDYAGSVMGDLSSRRGMVQGMDDMVGGGKAIKAEVPLSEMFGYSTTLRSMSQGRATYTMEFKHYSEAPRNVSEAIVASRAK